MANDHMDLLILPDRRARDTRVDELVKHIMGRHHALRTGVVLGGAAEGISRTCCVYREDLKTTALLLFAT